MPGGRQDLCDTPKGKRHRTLHPRQHDLAQELPAHIPTVASTHLARELRAQRDNAGMSQEAVAEEMGWAESKLYRIENDKSRVLQRDVKRLLKLYETEEKQAEVIAELGRLAGEPDWWHQYSGAIPEWFQVYVVLEASASHVFGYQSELVPGIRRPKATRDRSCPLRPSPTPTSRSTARSRFE
ncbi:helix-turn-helix transcriptional regulator [Nonomuraea sp. NPDC049141]|uniref:helix-turn-helix domain-containing protein n=1 Tax=Nonomuraea sp. NPDC049141 TaxID=3155500 RepID=UPI0033EE68DA